MKTYEINFWGKTIGSLGIQEGMSKTIVAPTEDEAVQELYNDYEHIMVRLITEVK